MIKKILLLILLTLTLIAENNETKELSLYDAKDGALDLSDYLSSAYGFLPVPSIITEPALGYGLGLGLIYLHDDFTGKKLDSGRVVPASMSGLVFMGTQNGTKLAAGFHIGYYYEDRLRVNTFIGLPSINIDTYVQNDAISTNIKGPIVYQALKFRMFDTNLFLGGAYIYTSLNTQVGIIAPINSTEAAVNFILEYDARDNTVSPSSGYFVNIKTNFFREEVGSDSNFEKYIGNGYFYMPVLERLNVNLKLSAESISGEDTSFYNYPFISLRGLPILKVQGEHVTASELEVCWDFTSRWEGLVFGGVGRAFGSDQFGVGDTDFEDAKNHLTKGVGFRYLIARKFGMKMGVDVASSEFDDAFYIQFGSAWAGF